MVDIKVVGPGCKNCVELENRVKRVVEEMQIEATISKISDFAEIAKSGVLMTPGLIINGKVAIQGKLPSEGIIKNYIIEALRS
ncbi:MAG: thioredoxin family protein [Acidobacteriota bacterium]|nr:thioredoxin family protein [Thermoanaerobaculaceae bacterium]